MRGEYIDTAKFIYKPTADDLKVKTHEIKHSFADFKFSAMTNANLARRGYTTPSPIQDKTIPLTMRGADIIGLARTGSGKTAAFLLPLIQKAEANPDFQALILAPTRELATQINTELRDFTQGMRIFSTVCVGGLPIYRQIQDLKRRNNFIIATPGRLKDLADRGVVKYNNVGAVVLDEVDHMLDMGFVDDITAILEQLPKTRQSFFFSATMPPRIKALMDRFLKNPELIEIESTGSSAKSVEQDIIRVTDRAQKIPKLLEILEDADTERTLIFVETKAGVEKLSDELEFHGYKVGYIHGDKPQRARQRTLDDFKSGKTSVMIATDVAARGIDIKDVTHVINFTIPQTHNDYIHRIGRTGRAGKTGKAFTFV
jgi:superfamily II DNA/RNA helicase